MTPQEKLVKIRSIESRLEEATQDSQDLRICFEDCEDDKDTLFSLKTRLETTLAIVRELTAGD